MNNEEIIKNFLTKMVVQDNRATATPYFYVIRTKVQDIAPIDNCDEVKYYWQDSSYNSMAEIEAYWKENDYSEEEIRDAKREVNEYGIKDRWDERCMFLTEDDAANHLKANHYHYSHDAHTYVKHAWRAPQLEEFLKSLLQHFNIEKKNET